MASVPCPPDCTNPNYHLHTAPEDPAYFLLEDAYTTTPDLSIYRANCYICTDKEFAQMGMPLCTACVVCKVGHVAADDEECDRCGANQYEQNIGPGPFQNIPMIGGTDAEEVPTV